MKQFVTHSYTFNPGTIGSGYIDLSRIPKFDIRRLIAIINQTNGKVLYSTGSQALKYLVYSPDGKLYFNQDTSSQDPEDDIQILYDQEVNTVDTTVMLNNLLSIIANPGIRDKSQNADRVAVVNTVPVTVSSGTITTLSALAGYQAQLPVQNNNLAAWYLSCRKTIT